MVCWLLASLGSLAVRPLIPVDETRYAAVAWEMVWRHSYWVPYLNGHIYAEKPPMLFWLIQIGWRLFGIVDWWPRLVGPLFALLSLLLTRRIARRLWPERNAQFVAPVILAGTLYWALFTGAVMLDVILSALVLVAIAALIDAWRSARLAPFLIAGVALGLAALTKGPVVLLPVAGVALAAPWWASDRSPSWGAWYFGFILAIVVAFVVGFAWLIPAGLKGGAAYWKAIGLHQTADSLSRSFQHPRPIWWYLPVVPLMLFPWSLWPPVWRAVSRIRQIGGDPGVRLCLAWAVPAFVALSLISAKQPHYLLPLLPAFALLVARALDEVPRRVASHWFLPGLLLLTGVAWLLMPFATRLHGIAAWVATAPPMFAAVFFVLAAAAIVLARPAAAAAHVRVLAIGSVVWMLALGYGLFEASWPAFDVRPIAAEVGKLAAQGTALGHAGSYNGEYHFYPRLKVEIAELRGGDILDWVRAHPDGALIAGYAPDRVPPPGAAAPIYSQPFRTDDVMIWHNRDVIANPSLLNGAHQ